MSSAEGFNRCDGFVGSIPQNFINANFPNCPMCGTNDPYWTLKDKFEFSGHRILFRCKCCGCIMSATQDDFSGRTKSTAAMVLTTGGAVNAIMKKKQGKDVKTVYLKFEDCGDMAASRALEGQEFPIEEVQAMAAQAAAAQAQNAVPRQTVYYGAPQNTQAAPQTGTAAPQYQDFSVHYDAPGAAVQNGAMPEGASAPQMNVSYQNAPYQDASYQNASYQNAPYQDVPPQQNYTGAVYPDQQQQVSAAPAAPKKSGVRIPVATVIFSAVALSTFFYGLILFFVFRMGTVSSYAEHFELSTAAVLFGMRRTGFAAEFVPLLLMPVASILAFIGGLSIRKSGNVLMFISTVIAAVCLIPGSVTVYVLIARLLGIAALAVASVHFLKKGNVIKTLVKKLMLAIAMASFFGLCWIKLQAMARTISAQVGSFLDAGLAGTGYYRMLFNIIGRSGLLSIIFLYAGLLIFGLALLLCSPWKKAKNS